MSDEGYQHDRFGTAIHRLLPKRGRPSASPRMDWQPCPQALRSHDRDDLVLYLGYAPEAAGEVQKMVKQERMCCAFLTFDLHAQADTICLTITAPEAARESTDVLFGQFLPGDGTPKYGSVFG